MKLGTHTNSNILILFSIGNTFFGQIWSKKLKSSIKDESCYLYYFKYAEFGGDIHLPVLDTLFKEIWSKIQNSMFKMKFGT